MPAILDEATRIEHRRRNMAHSVLLMGGIGAVTAIASALIWGLPGIVVTLAGIVMLYTLGPRVPPETVMRLYRARPIESHARQLAHIVDVLAARADLPKRPRLHVVPSATLNAFAAGTPDHAAIAVTEGLLRRLTLRETAAVLAHEISHIRNNDLWVMGLADVMTRFTQTLAYVAVALAVLNLGGMVTGDRFVSWWAILLLYLAPTLSSLLQLALSRTREFDADLEAAMLTGDPLALASALRRIESTTGRVWEDMMLPVPMRRVPQPSLLRSHPPTEERIARLAELHPRSDLPPIEIAEEPLVTLVGIGPAEMRPRYRWPGVWY